MTPFVPNSDLRRDIPLLTREKALDDIRWFEHMYPGPYTLEGFQFFPPERYGFKNDGGYFEYTPNKFMLVGRAIKQKTYRYNHIEEVYDELRGHLASMAPQMPRVKIYVLSGEGVRVYVDSQVMEKARKLIIPV